MINRNKKERELEILRMIYLHKNHPHVIEHEMPDFLVDKTNTFGVEVTEFYIDETGARLENKPGYTNDVISNQNVHKNDVANLKIITIEEVTHSNGKKANFPKQQAVLQQSLDVYDRFAILIKQINNKSTLYSNYDPNLEVINLIVHDKRGALFDGIHDNLIIRMLEDVKNKGILQTQFKTIFLVVPVNKGRDTKVYILKE